MFVINTIRGHSKAEFVQEAKAIAELAFPALIAQFTRVAVYIINALFLGHLQDDAMAAAAVAGSWHNVAIYFGIGMSFAMDTLVSQAYGARNFKFIGIVFQNALVVVCLMFIPISLAFWFTEPILLLLKQDPDLSRLAGTYNKVLLIGVLPLLIYRAQTQYLQNQRILKPAMVSGFITVLLSIPLNRILISGLPEMHIFGLHGAALHSQLKVFGGWKGLGFIGAPLAGALTWTAQPIILWIYVTWTGVHRQSWSGCDIKQATNPRNLVNYLKLGVPDVLTSLPFIVFHTLVLLLASFMLAMETVGFELATIFVGAFHDVTATKAHAIGFNLTIFGFIIPISIAIGATTRVGNRLGEGNVYGAKLSALIGYLIIMAVQTITCLVMVILRRPIASFYSDSEPVLDFCSRLMPLVAGVSFFDGVQNFNSCLLRSIGRPLAGSVVNFIGYYVLALPTAAGLGWGAKLKIFGIWLGLIAGLAGATVGYFILIYRVDWDKEAQLAKERVSDGKKDPLELETGPDYAALAEGDHIGASDTGAHMDTQLPDADAHAHHDISDSVQSKDRNGVELMNDEEESVRLEELSTGDGDSAH